MREDDEDTEECLYCRRPIYDDAVACPHCGNYQSREDAPSRPRPWWIVALAVVCLLIALWWVFR